MKTYFSKYYQKLLRKQSDEIQVHAKELVKAHMLCKKKTEEYGIFKIGANFAKKRGHGKDKVLSVDNSKNSVYGFDGRANVN